MKSFFIFTFSGFREVVKRFGIRLITIFSREINTNNHGNLESSREIFCKIIKNNILEILYYDDSFFFTIFSQLILIFSFFQGSKIEPALSNKIITCAFKESHDNRLFGIIITEFRLCCLEFRISTIVSFPQLTFINNCFNIVPNWEKFPVRLSYSKTHKRLSNVQFLGYYIKCYWPIWYFVNLFTFDTQLTATFSLVLYLSCDSLLLSLEKLSNSCLTLTDQLPIRTWCIKYSENQPLSNFVIKQVLSNTYSKGMGLGKSAFLLLTCTCCETLTLLYGSLASWMKV